MRKLLGLSQAITFPEDVSQVYNHKPGHPTEMDYLHDILGTLEEIRDILIQERDSK